KKKKRKLPVKEARKVLIQQEAQKMIDTDEAQQEAVYRAEQTGIVFIDEIDKVAGKGQETGNVSREGIQRDIVPMIEGSTAVAKYGAVKTEHVLLLAAGAFKMAEQFVLIPELQVRFPGRVACDKLEVDDIIEILTEPSNALLKQYTALVETEGIKVEFKED